MEPTYVTPGVEECLGRRARYFGPHCRLEPVGVVCSLPSRHQMFKVMSDGPGSTFGDISSPQQLQMGCRFLYPVQETETVVNLVEADCVLWAYSTHANISDQVDGLWEERQRSPVTRSWLILSI